MTRDLLALIFFVLGMSIASWLVLCGLPSVLADMWIDFQNWKYRNEIAARKVWRRRAEIRMLNEQFAAWRREAGQ